MSTNVDEMAPNLKPAVVPPKRAGFSYIPERLRFAPLVLVIRHVLMYGGLAI